MKDRSNDRTTNEGETTERLTETERGKRKERFDVDADEPEDAISRTDDAR